MQSIIITQHTTSSTPLPHILYNVVVHLDDKSVKTLLKRYSEFYCLKCELSDPYDLPPKHIITNSVLPFAWLDDGLIAERKLGLQNYINSLLADPEYKARPELAKFLDIDGGEVQMAEVRIPVKGTADEPDDKRRSIAASYYPSWAVDVIPPNKVDFARFDILFYAFVTPTGTAGLDWGDGDEKSLAALVTSARNSGQPTKIVLSVGGWTGSHWFSQAMSTGTKRLNLINNLLELVNKYGLDGIDVDWEYPNAKGSGNPHSPSDSENLLDFFKLLRAALGPTRVISAAVTQLPWLDANGKPLADVSEYAKVMTYVNIMNYDAFGASAKPGPNAPLSDLCGTSTQPEATAKAAFSQWTAAGMPASKLLLGLPLYGYVSKSTKEKLSGSQAPALDDPVFPRGAHPRGPPGAETFGDLSKMWGQQIAFTQLVESGTLVKNGTNYGAGNGFTMGWDDCSDTPFLFNKAKTTVVTYDDTWSIASKTRFAKISGMGGCFTWSLDQDDGLALHTIICENLGRK